MVRKASSHELKPKRVGLPVPHNVNKCTEEQVREALYACSGRIFKTAAMLDIHPGTLRKYIYRDYPRLKKVLRACKGYLGDCVEEKLYDAALKKDNVRAMIHILARQFPERGWTLTKNVNVKHEEATPRSQGIVISDEKKAEILAAVLAKFPLAPGAPPAPPEGLKELPPAGENVGERIILEHQPDAPPAS